MQGMESLFIPNVPEAVDKLKMNRKTFMMNQPTLLDKKYLNIICHSYILNKRETERKTGIRFVKE